MFTDLLALTVRGLHAAGALLLMGTLCCLHLAPVAEQSLARWRTRWLQAALLLAVSLLVLGVGVVALQVAAVESDAPWRSVAYRLLLESRFGIVWIAREALALAAAIVLVIAVLRPTALIPPLLALLAAGAALAIAPLSGHSAAEEPAWPMLTVHAMHLLAAGAWWGALPALATLILAARNHATTATALRTFRRFSAAALWVMLVVVGSGVALAITLVQRWPALLATTYGRLLICKLVLLAAVLGLAAALRWRLLPALARTRSDEVQRLTGRWIVAECLVAAVIVVLATQLGQTVPARHDAIVWWLPVRFSIDATWGLKWTPAKVWSGLALIGLAAAVAAFTVLGRLPRRGAFLSTLALIVLATALALPALLVQAYPDTYRKPSVPYQTISVAAGIDLFAEHCTGCHGHSGHGDGEQAKNLALPPADLTEPHTALHTAGDIFWWLTHGKPPGVMPGFAAELDEDDRWDLINFLRTLSAGYQARILGPRIARRQPWLGAVDFAYIDQHGQPAALRDARGGSAVLLVFFTLPGSQARLAQLAHEHQRLRAAGAEIIAVPMTTGDAIGSSLPYAVVTDGATETARAYALLRRTLSNPDPRDAAPAMAHMEMLIDRFGYIRARWVALEGEGWQRPQMLQEQLSALAREPQILPPPDDHVH